MNYIKSTLIAPALAVLLSTTLLAAESYTIENQSLKEAIEVLSKKSNIPYMVDGKLLQGKKSPNIKNIEGLENALKKVLQGINLEAVIEDGTILIRKKAIKNESSSNLGQVEVIANASNITEGSGSYTIASMNTATKMNLSIKETPQSISVITSEQINDQGIDSIDDVLEATTGVLVEKKDTQRTRFYARGFRIRNFQINGIPSNLKATSTEEYQDMAIYDRVEIVRGATGLLVGAGDPSAAVNLVRKRASSKDFKGTINLEVGSWNKKKATLDLSGALNEEGSLRARVVFKKSTSDSFRDFETQETDVFYTVFENDISDNTLLTIGASYQKVLAKGAIWGRLPAFYSDNTPTNLDRSTTIASPWSFREIIQKKYFTNLEHIFNNDAKINLSYSHGIVNSQGKISSWYPYPAWDENTGLGLEDKAIKYTPDDKTQNTLDLYTSVPFEAFNLEHEFIAGLSYDKTKIYTKRSIGAYTTLGATQRTTEEPTIWPEATVINDEEIEQTGIYLATRLSLRDDLKLILGSRLSNYKVKDKKEALERKEQNIITPYAGIVYDLNETYSFYANYSDIFNPQSQQDTQGKTLDPIIGKNFEIGSKASFNDDKLNVSLSIFRIEQDNLAQKDAGKKILNTTDDAYYGAKGTVSKGFEAEVSGEVNDSLWLSLGISKAIIKDHKGEELNTHNASTLINSYAKYKFQKLSIGAGVNWRNSAHKGEGVKKVEQKAYFITSAMVKYDFSKYLSLQVNINNLFDKTYYVSIDTEEYNYGAPRNATVKLKYTF